MASRRRSGSAASLARKSTELAWATPQVMAHRMMRMALAGTPLSERDRKEFTLMGMEKLGAFTTAYHAMVLASLVNSQTLAMQMWSAWLTPWMGNRGSNRLAQQMQQATVNILGKGLAPVHAKATANARRLATTPLVAAPRRRTRA